MLFSIIIPAYNAEKFISKCLLSILRQDTTSCEIIVVDDGSKDKTKEIINSFINEYKDKCIRYIYKDNGGASSARNAGIKAATGQYIVFLDADDTLTDTALKKFNESINQIDADLYMFSFNFKKNDNLKKAEICNINDFLIESDNSINIIDSFVQKTNELLLWYPWGKIYSKGIILKNNLYFDENLICSEDFVFFYTYLMVSHSIQYYNFPVVNYTQAFNGSLSSYKGLKQVVSDCNAYEMVFNKIYNANKNDKITLNFISKFYIYNLVNSDIKTKSDIKIIKKNIKKQEFIFNFNKSIKVRLKRLCIKCLGLKLTLFVVSVKKKVKGVIKKVLKV